MDCKKISERVSISWLDSTRVSVVKNKFCSGCGCESQIGNSEFMNFMNSEDDLEKMKNSVPEPLLSAILTVWGKEIPDKEDEVDEILEN